MPKSTLSRPFIVIEALDAGGSQTQTDWLVRHLKREKYAPTQLHFPQEDTATGQLIYEKFLLAHNQQQFSRREQALLYIQDFFSQAELLHAVTSSRKKQDLVVSDRFCTSTAAYQTVGLTGKKRQEMLEWINWLCFAGTPALPKPTQVIFLDTPVEVSLARLANKKKDFFENRQKLTAIRNSYLRLAQEEKWIVISSVTEAGEERTRKDLHQEIWESVETTL